MRNQFLYTLFDHLIVREKSSILKRIAFFLSQIQLLLYLISLIFDYSTLDLSTATEYLQSASRIAILDPKNVLHDLTSFLYVVLLGYQLFVFFIIGKVLKSARNQTFPSRAFVHMVQDLGYYHLQILYAPCLVFFTRCAKEYLDGNFEVFGIKNHEALMAVGVFAGCLNFIFGVALSFLSFEPYISNGLLTRRFSSVDFLVLLSKSSLTLGTVIDFNGKISRDIALVLPLILILIYGLIIQLASPYYILKTSTTLSRLNALHLASSLTGICIVYLDSEKSISGILLGCGLASLLWVLYSFLEKRRYESIITSLKKSDSESQAFQRFSVIEEILASHKFEHNSSTEQKLSFFQLLADHHNDCSTKYCYCRYFYQDEAEFKVLPIELEALKEDFIPHLQRKFFQSNLKGKDFPWFKMLFANKTVMTRLEHYPLALSLLHSIHLYKIDMVGKFLVKDSERKISKYVSKLIYQQEDVVDIIKFSVYKEKIAEFQHDLLSVIDLHKSYWDLYQTNDPHMMSLYKISTMMAKKDDKITQKWNDIVNKFDILALEDHLYYAGYQAIIRNKEIHALKLLKHHEFQRSKVLRALLSTDDINDITINSSKNLTVFLSLGRHTLGNVLNCYGRVYEALGWQATDIIGRKINNIIPEYIRNHHDSFLKAHVTSGRINLLYKNRTVYGQHKNGYILPLKVYVCPSIHLDEEFSYIGIIRPLKTHENTIVINESGVILCCTREIGLDLDLDPENKHKLNIEEFCPSFSSLNKMFNTASYMSLNRSLIMDSNDPEDLNYLKARKLLNNLASENAEVINSMMIPSSEADFINMMDIYKKLKHDGWKQMFVLKDNVKANFICKIKEDQNFTKEKVKFIVLRKLGMIKPKKMITVNFNKNNFHIPIGLFETTVSSNLRLRAGMSDQIENYGNGMMSRYVNQKQVYDPGLGDISLDDQFETNNEEEMNKIRSKLELHQENPATMAGFEAEEEESDEYNKNEEEIGYNDFEGNVTRLIMNRKKAISKVATESAKSKGTTSNTAVALFEKNLMKYPKAKTLKIFIMFSLIYFAGATILFFIFNFFVSSRILESANLTSLTGIITDRTTVLLEIHRQTRLILLSKEGFIPSLALSPALESKYYDKIKTLVGEIETLTLQELSKMEENYSFDITLLLIDTLMTGVIPGEPSTLVAYNQAISQIIYAALEIMREGVTHSKHEIEFILNNILSDLLIKSESFPELLLQAVSDNTDRIEILINGIVIVIFIGSISLLIFGIFIEVKQMKKKLRFFEGLLRPRVSEYYEYTESILYFDHEFRKHLAEENPKMNQDVIKYKPKVFVKSKSQTRVRRPNTKGVNRTFIKRLVINFIILLTALIGIIIIRQIAIPLNEEFFEFNEAIVINKKILNANLLLFISTYDYIGTESSSKMREQPIASQYELQLALAKRYTIYNLAFKETDMIFPEIYNLLQDNLCDSTFQKYSFYCDQATSNLQRFGLIGLNSQLISIYESVKQAYDDNHNKANALNITFLRTAETIVENNYYKIYDIIEHLFINKIRELETYYRTVIWAANISMIVLCILMAIASYYWIYLAAYAERFHLQRMLETVPLSNILENAHLKAFLPVNGIKL